MSENNSAESASILKLIVKDFDRPGIESVISVKDMISLDELKKYLAEKLAYLLEYKYDKLLNTLYLIDIDEEKLTRLFAAKNREHIPTQLADLIIERQLQKLHFRQKYKREMD